MAIIVCPQCRYGFQGDDASGEQVCPRGECEHRWEALSQTIRAVHANSAPSHKTRQPPDGEEPWKVPSSCVLRLRVRL